MVRPNERKRLTNVFVIAIGILLVVGGYILIGIMSVLPSSDNTTRALVMLAILVIISSIAQLATFAMIANGRAEGGKSR